MFALKQCLVALLLAVVFNGKGTDGAEKKGFHLGCNFKDNKYQLRTEKPTWGEEMTPEEFTLDKFKAFLADATEIYTEMLKSTKTNELDQLLKFVKSYKAQNGTKKLDAFYKDYEVIYDSDDDSAALTLEFFDKLRKKHPEVEDNLFLVSTAMDVPIDHNEEYENLAVIMPQDYYHGHVAGALVFSIADELGIVIFDLGLGVESPVVVTESDDGLQKNVVPGGISAKIVFNSVNGEIVIADVYDGADGTSDKIIQKHMYFTGLPFCSFLDTYTKANLLTPEHGILSRYANGAPKGYLFFKILPKVVTKNRHEFILDYFNEKFEVFQKEIGFYSLDEGFSEGEKQALDTLSKHLGMSADEIKKEMTAFKTELFDNEPLITEIFELKKNLVRADFEKGNQCDPNIDDSQKVLQCMETSWGRKRLLKLF